MTTKHEHDCDCFECFECFKAQYEGQDMEYVLSCLYAKKKELEGLYKVIGAATQRLSAD